MEQESSNIQMEDFMRDHGNLAIKMEQENRDIKMAIYMKVNGLIILKMEQENLFGLIILIIQTILEILKTAA